MEAYCTDQACPVGPGTALAPLSAQALATAVGREASEGPPIPPTASLPSIKARRFSRQHNRIVKQESSSSEDEDWGTPKPFYQLLADRARCSSQPASQLSPHHR